VPSCSRRPVGWSTCRATWWASSGLHGGAANRRRLLGRWTGPALDLRCRRTEVMPRPGRDLRIGAVEVGVQLHRIKLCEPCGVNADRREQVDDLLVIASSVGDLAERVRIDAEKILALSRRSGRGSGSARRGCPLGLRGLCRSCEGSHGYPASFASIGRGSSRERSLAAGWALARRSVMPVRG